MYKNNQSIHFICVELMQITILTCTHKSINSIVLITNLLFFSFSSTGGSTDTSPDKTASHLFVSFA